jgi:hypothetical protein
MAAQMLVVTVTTTVTLQLSQLGKFRTKTVVDSALGAASESVCFYRDVGPGVSASCILFILLFPTVVLLSPSGPGAANRDARAGPDRAVTVTVTAVAAGAGPPKLAVETQCGPARHGDSGGRRRAVTAGDQTEN